MHAFISVNFWVARYLFIKNFISIAYVLAHPLQEINKWTATISSRGVRRGKRWEWWEVRSPRETQFSPIFERGFPSELSCCSRKSPRTFFWEGLPVSFLCFFRPLSETKRVTSPGELSARFAPSGPFGVFRFPRMNFRRIDLCSRKRAWKFKVLKSKFPRLRCILERLLRSFYS